MAKKCDSCKTENEENFALQLLKDYSKQAHRWFVAFIIVVACWLATIGGFIWYLNQYDFSGTEIIVEQDATDGGDTNYIGNDGDIIG